MTYLRVEGVEVWVEGGSGMGMGRDKDKGRVRRYVS